MNTQQLIVEPPISKVAAETTPRTSRSFLHAGGAEIEIDIEVPLQAAHPDLSLTVERMGTQPYQTVEMYERLKSAMRDYRSLVATQCDTKALEAEILFLAGILGHYVGDGSMPLHTSIYPNGWSGPTPNGYTTEHHIHALFESMFVGANVKIGDLAPLVKANEPKMLGDVFDDYLAYLRHSNTLVEKTYQLEKTGTFSGEGTPEGKAFALERFAAGATEVRDIIYTAWVRSAGPGQAREENSAPLGKSPA